VSAGSGRAETELAGSMAGKHVLLVVENVPAAIDHRVRKQVDDLLGAGYRVSVITSRHPGNSQLRRPGVTVLEYPAPAEPAGAAGYLREYGLSFAWAAALAARARLRGRVDVVQLCQPPDIYFPLARVLAWSGATVVVDQRDLMPEVFSARYGRRDGAVPTVLRWLERRTQRVARHTIVVNDYLRNRIIGAGAQPEQVTIVRNGPVLARVAAARPDPATRAGFGRLCCWIGKMGRQDRVDLLLEVIAELVHGRGRRDCRFVFIGDGECLDELRARASDLRLDPWVSFPGWLPERDVFAHLATADLGLDTSLQVEVSPVKVLEYLAFGLPVVAFDLSETAALVRDAGTLVEPGDVGRFVDEMVALLDDPRRRAELGRAGRDRIRAELCWEQQAVSYLAVIARAAGPRPAPHPTTATTPDAAVAN
jgi:glycosyltransferase involved in cell wall biosynthesis